MMEKTASSRSTTEIPEPGNAIRSSFSLTSTRVRCGLQPVSVSSKERKGSNETGRGVRPARLIRTEPDSNDLPSGVHTNAILSM